MHVVQDNVEMRREPIFCRFVPDVIVWVYKRMPQDIETILTSFDVFLSYAYSIKISVFYSCFYYEKTSK